MKPQIIDSLKDYNPKKFLNDLIAGNVTVENVDTCNYAYVIASKFAAAYHKKTKTNNTYSYVSYVGLYSRNPDNKNELKITSIVKLDVATIYNKVNADKEIENVYNNSNLYGMLTITESGKNMIVLLSGSFEDFNDEKLFPTNYNVLK